MNLELETEIKSDTAPLHALVKDMLDEQLPRIC